MLISLIIPVYNVEEYLEKCLESVVNQTYKNLEIICIDDTSTDESLSILEKYAKNDNRFTIIKNSQNLGLGLTRNEGIKIASGQYIHFLDSDDWLEDGIYEKLVKKIENIGNIDVLCFRYNRFDNVSETLFHPLDYHNVDQILCPSKDIKAFENWDRFCWMKLHKRQFLIENDIFFNACRSMEDVEHAALVYVKCKSLCYTDIVGVNYRINRESSLVTFATRNIKSTIKQFEKNKELYKDLPPEIKYRLLGFDYSLIFHIINIAFDTGELSIPEILFAIIKLTTKDSRNYIYRRFYPEFLLQQSGFLLNFLKIVLKKILSKYYHVLLRLKKRLTS